MDVASWCFWSSIETVGGQPVKAPKIWIVDAHEDQIMSRSIRNFCQDFGAGVGCFLKRSNSTGCLVRARDKSMMIGLDESWYTSHCRRSCFFLSLLTGNEEHGPHPMRNKFSVELMFSQTIRNQKHQWFCFQYGGDCFSEHCLRWQDNGFDHHVTLLHLWSLKIVLVLQ